MIRFEGNRQLPCSPADAWQKLLDPSFLIQCVQGGQATSAAPTATEAQCRVRTNVPFVQGTMLITVRISGAEPPTELRVIILGEGNNAKSEVMATLLFTENKGTTHIHWIAEVRSLGGLLKAAPAHQVQAAAQKVINETWALLSTKIAK